MKKYLSILVGLIAPSLALSLVAASPPNVEVRPTGAIKTDLGSVPVFTENDLRRVLAREQFVAADTPTRPTAPIRVVVVVGEEAEAPADFTAAVAKLGGKLEVKYIKGASSRVMFFTPDGNKKLDDLLLGPDEKYEENRKLVTDWLVKHVGTGTDPPVKGKKFARGAKPTPRWKLVSAPKHKTIEQVVSQIAYVPKQLDMWGNDQYGCCVTSEEAFAKACYNPEIFLSATLVVNWAQQYGYRDGANLTDVMDTMKVSGFVSGTQMYNDGGYTSVDFTSEANIQSALTLGPIKIGIDADALPSGAGNVQGWTAFGGSPGQFSNEDHCVSIAGFGPGTWLYQQLGVPPPSNLPAGTLYLLYTWSTIGVVDEAWIMSTCGEAWVRNPTTIGVPPLTPTPTPTPTPVPVPGTTTITLTSEQIAQVIAQNGNMTLQELADLLAASKGKSSGTILPKKSVFGPADKVPMMPSRP